MTSPIHAANALLQRSGLKARNKINRSNGLAPDVAEATAAHLAAVAAAAAPAAEERKKREADPAVLAGGSRIISAPTPLIHNAPVLPVAAPLGYHGLGYGLGYGHGYGLGYAGYAGHLGYGHGYGLGYAGY